MPIVGGLDIHRKQITFDYLDLDTGELQRGQIAPADRAHQACWLARRFAGRCDVEFAVEGCTGWRYVAEELARAGVVAHVAEPADTAALRGRKRHAKTDRTDSRHLRQTLVDGRLPECCVPPSQILERRHLSRQGPGVLRWCLYEAGKTHACAAVGDHAYYAQVKDRIDGKRAAISEARKITRQACHLLAELGDDALAAA